MLILLCLNCNLDFCLIFLPHVSLPSLFQEVELEDECGAEEEAAGQQLHSKKLSEECDEDGLEELPSSICRRKAIGRGRGPISRKASQTSVYLQEWDIPYEQLQLGELIGKVRLQEQTDTG